MFVWILILAACVALLSLILHDATKDDSDGSAILIAARRLGALVGWTILKARMFQKALSHRISQTSAAKPPAKLEKAIGTNPLSSEPIRLSAPLVIEQVEPPPRKKWWRKDGRASKTIPELELTIAEAVKATPSCEAFVGVVVRQMTPKSRLDANWELRGIKFGKADRKIANQTLATVIERMQRQFRLTEIDPHHASHPPAPDKQVRRGTAASS